MRGERISGHGVNSINASLDRAPARYCKFAYLNLRVKLRASGVPLPPTQSQARRSLPVRSGCQAQWPAGHASRVDRGVGHGARMAFESPAWMTTVTMIRRARPRARPPRPLGPALSVTEAKAGPGRGGRGAAGGLGDRPDR